MDWNKKWGHKNETLICSSKLTEIKIPRIRFFFTLWKIYKYLTQHTVTVLGTQLLAKDEIFWRKLQTLLCQLLISNPYGMTFHAVVVPALELFFKSCLAYCALGTQLCWQKMQFSGGKLQTLLWQLLNIIFCNGDQNSSAVHTHTHTLHRVYRIV